MGQGTQHVYAIVGIGCRFPGHANSPAEFWKLLCDGVDAITEVPRDRFDIDQIYDPDPAKPGKLYVRRAGFADFVDQFAAGFFGISPREALQMDPQQRMLLEVTWEALEDGGHSLDTLRGQRTGVFVGVCSHDYSDILGNPAVRHTIGTHTITGTASSILANRISYVFDFRGPSIVVDTACSASLTAIHLACSSLRAGECDIAIAGGVNAYLAPEFAIAVAKGGMLSPDGRCKAFDARANGYVRGEGAGLVILKSLDAAIASGDPIYAVVRGSSINQDGRTVGLSSPSAAAQTLMLREALRAAGLDRSDIGYVEAHGTGTAVGDPVEATAIGEALSAGRDGKAPLIIGSVKTNIGHLEAAAGIAGLIKTALILKHQQIPPSLHFETPNPAIPFADLGLRVATRVEPWPELAKPATAGVNSFGFGGSNAHVILGEAPASVETLRAENERTRLLLLSAKSAEALRQRSRDIATFVRDQKPELDDLCYTAGVRRTQLEHRVGITGTTHQGFIDSLEAFESENPRPNVFSGHPSQGGEPKLAFIFPGMGPQSAGMGRELRECEPVFGETLHECDEIVRRSGGWSLLTCLDDEGVWAEIGEVAISQVTNFALQASLNALWRSWGVVPDAAVGHSAGELAAAHAAGIVSLEDGMRIAFHRGRLLQRLAGRGRMIAAALSPEEAEREMAPYAGRVWLAAINSPSNVALSGDAAVLEELVASLESRQIFARFLAVTLPCHGVMMEEIQAELFELLQGLSVKEPSIPIVSTAFANTSTKPLFDPQHWCINLRNPVYFRHAMDRLIGDGCDIFLEVGNHPVLRAAISECLTARSRRGLLLASMRKGEGDCAVALGSLAALYTHGRRVSFPGVFRDHGGKCISLPKYPWQREHFGTGQHVALSGSTSVEGTPSGHPLLGVRLSTPQPTWQADLAEADDLRYHVVENAPVYPAAAYIETALAAGARLWAGETIWLELIAFHKMLVLSSEPGQRIQFHCDRNGAFEIHSSSGKDWVLHASGSLRHGGGLAPGPSDLNEIRRRCRSKKDIEQWYAALESRGLRYSGPFRSVAELWEGDGEALGRVQGKSGAAFQIYTALLDCALQVVSVPAFAAADSPAHGALPASVDRIQHFGSIGTEFWVHAALRARDATGITADVRIFDESGRAAMVIEGFRAAYTGRRASEHSGRWLHELRWQREDVEPNLSYATGGAIAEAVAPFARRIANEVGGPEYQTDIGKRMNGIATSFIEGTLLGLAVDRVLPRHKRFLARLREIAATEHTSPDPHELAADTAAMYPRWAGGLDLLVRCGEALGDILVGAKGPQEVLFTPDALSVLSEFYTDGPALSYHNRVLAEAVETIARGIPNTRLLRVLEIGAGTGGTTECVLARLPVGSVEYCFTDVSPFFLAYARRRFALRPDVTFATVDIETGVSDSLPHTNFDIVIAANVVHATADARASLRNAAGFLAPGGVFAMIECVIKEVWADLIFGIFQGWWRFEDLDVRPSHPLLPTERWIELLRESGFASAARLPEADAERTSIAAIVANAPISCGASMISHGASAPQLYYSTIAAASTGSELVRCQVSEAQAITSLLRNSGSSSLWIITKGAQNVEDESCLPNPAQAALWGIGRVIMSEFPKVRCRLVDLSAEPTADETEALAQEITAKRDEEEIAFRGTRRYVRRLRHITNEELHRNDDPRPVRVDKGSVRLEIRKPGAMESLVLSEVRCRQPAPGELLIRIRAAGLNFRDVMVSLGLIPMGGRKECQPLGVECSGVVLAVGAGVGGFKPGDEVAGIAIGGGFASHACIPADFAVPKPDRLSFEDAACLLVPFITAKYCINILGQVQPGERVLVHAATGGVGLAAVQLCNNVGAEIFATAGSPEKRSYLRALGICHVMDSRTMDFADQVMHATNGEGVDVVVNSIAGAIEKGLAILRRHGRFIEIGKRDFLENSSISVGSFTRTLSFFSVDEHSLHSMVVSLRHEIIADLEAGRIRPLPRMDFRLTEAEAAFRFMAQAKHIGKVVITVEEDEYIVPPSETEFLFKKDATYLITGGLGGLGLATAEWLASEGAGSIVLIGRSAVPRHEYAAAFQRLLRSSAKVTVIGADVSVDDEVPRILDEIRATLPPLKGVFHEAMVLDDAPLFELNEERWSAVLGPKVAGAWNLHRMTADLDFFVLFSSGASVVGNYQQANYAAANAFLDGLAHHRNCSGLPALSVGWGMLADVGYVSQRPEVEKVLVRSGVEAIPPHEAFATLKQLLRARIPHVLAMRIDWSRWGRVSGTSRLKRYSDLLREVSTASSAERRFSAAAPGDRFEALQRHLVQRIAGVLGASPAKVDPAAPLTTLGLDSLMAVEVSSLLKMDLNFDYPAVRLLQDTSVRELASRIAEQTGIRAVDAESQVAPATSRLGLPLAAEQRRLWFLQQLDPESPAYNISACVRFKGILDTRAIETSINEVIARHAALRATFTVEQGEPAQWIAAELRIPIPVVDTADADENEDLRQPFDIGRGPLIRGKILRFGPEEHTLLLTVHHLCADAWTFAIIARECAAAYQGTTLPPAADYAAFILKQPSVPDEGALAYWRTQLRDVPALALPTDRPRPAIRSLQGKRLEFKPEFLVPLETFSRAEGVTLFTTLLAAFEVLLHRYAGQEDFCVGIPVANRDREELKDLVGCFVNTLVMRAPLAGDPTFRELLPRVKRTVLDGFAHQDVPFDRLVSAVAPVRDASTTPLFQVLFVLHTVPMPPVGLPGVTFTPALLHNGTCTFDLILVINPIERYAWFEYNSDLFDEDRITRMAGHLDTLVRSVVRNPDERISALPLLTGQEVADLVPTESIGTAPERCLHQLYEDQVARTPDAIAIVGEQTWTYAELNAAADRIAAALHVAPDSRVAICADRSAAAIAAILGVLKAGAAFMPLDPTYPPERLAYMIRDAQPNVVITFGRYAARFSDTPVLVIEDIPQATRIPPVVAPSNLAYVLYTSGSTGQPKGVLIEHRSIVNQILWRQSAFPFNSDDAVLLSTTLCFDPSIWEIFGPLSYGARIVIAPERTLDGPALNETIRREQVTVMQAVPTVIRSLLEQNAFDNCTSLRRVFCGGEMLDAALQRRFFGASSAELINLYGTTETTIDSAYYVCSRDAANGPAPIGRPIANTRLYVLDRNLQPVPAGVPGEICVAGAGLARGYLNCPESRFVLGPNGDTIYRTGDFAKIRPDGNIELCGRIDRQMKVRGFRIEPAEIEAALRAHAGVSDAAVTACEDGLGAWIVPTKGNGLRTAELASHISNMLPRFMMPDRWQIVNALPLAPGGKSDRSALRMNAMENEPNLPLDEDGIAQIWKELLGVFALMPDDDFFDLGGHSLLAVQLAARMSQALGREVRVSEIYANPRPRTWISQSKATSA